MNAVEPGQTDRSDKPVPEASRRICALHSPGSVWLLGLTWRTGYVIEIGEKFSLQVQVTDGCTGFDDLPCCRFDAGIIVDAGSF